MTSQFWGDSVISLVYAICSFGLILDWLASESVQYFQFDQDGNMYMFRPGSGFTGPSVKVEPGFEMAEVKDLTQSLYESC